MNGIRRLMVNTLRAIAGVPAMGIETVHDGLESAFIFGGIRTTRIPMNPAIERQQKLQSMFG
jgi:hypothetical protein